jgi:hypothetical protein
VKWEHYSFRGSEQYSILTAMIVFRDFSALAIHGQESEFRKFIAFVPPDTCTNERIAQVTDQIDKIERLANDGTRVIAEIGGTIAQIQTQIDKYDHDLKETGTFLLRDDIRLKQERLRSMFNGKSASAIMPSCETKGRRVRYVCRCPQTTINNIIPNLLFNRSRITPINRDYKGDPLPVKFTVWNCVPFHQFSPPGVGALESQVELLMVFRQ